MLSSRSRRKRRFSCMTVEHVFQARAIRGRDESPGLDVKRLLSYSRRYFGNNGSCEQCYKRRAGFNVVVGCSPFSLQMVSSADTCLFMSPSVPRTVDATSSRRGRCAEWDNFTVSVAFGGVSWIYKVSRKPRYSFHQSSNVWKSIVS